MPFDAADTVAASSPEAAELDAFQGRYLDGPCVTAARKHAVIRVGDVRGDSRWAAYHVAVAEQGVRSILGIPLELRGEAAAAFDVYSTSLGNFFSPKDIDPTAHAVQEASSALLLAVRAELREETGTNLRAVLSSRNPIDLAVGVIMGQDRCTQDEAAAILRTASDHRNIRLRDLAVELLGDLDDPSPTGHFDA